MFSSKEVTDAAVRAYFESILKENLLKVLNSRKKSNEFLIINKFSFILAYDKIVANRPILSMKGFKLQDGAREYNDIYSAIIPRGDEYLVKADQIITTDNGKFKTNRLLFFQQRALSST